MDEADKPEPEAFHPGELLAQEKLGVKAKMAGIGRRVIRSYMPEQHREFYQQLPLLFVGASDHESDIWATAMFGKPGFIQSPDSKTLIIDSGLDETDPLFASLTEASEIGALGIEFATRRRNRVNAVITSTKDRRIELQVKQSFGNCPKYIQQRQLQSAKRSGPREARDFSDFDSEIVAMLERADTFFIASSYTPESATGNTGYDVSHRGGKPGFIQVETKRTFVFPDFQGNQLFNTLGNLMLNPKAGILLLDFEGDSLVHLTGKADVIWQSGVETKPPMTERLVRFTLTKGRAIKYAMPLSWAFETYSPFLPKE